MIIVHLIIRLLPLPHVCVSGKGTVQSTVCLEICLVLLGSNFKCAPNIICSFLISQVLCH